MVKIRCPIIKCMYNKEIEFKHYCTADEIMLRRREINYVAVHCMKYHR